LERKDIKAGITGLQAKAVISRVAAKGKSRIGIKKHGKYEAEITRGNEFNINGNLMEKERIIDRRNNLYKEIVTNIDTGEIVRDVEQKLTEHIGHGSAKFKNQTLVNTLNHPLRFIQRQIMPRGFMFNIFRIPGLCQFAAATVIH